VDDDSGAQGHAFCRPSSGLNLKHVETVPRLLIAAMVCDQG